MMKNFALIVVLLINHQLFGQKDTVTIGFYINRMYDFDLVTNAFSVDLWSWYISRDSSVDWSKAASITNTKTSNILTSEREFRPLLNKLWTYQHHISQIHHDWQTQKFPFDYQRLAVVIETDQDKTEQVIILDKEHCGVTNQVTSQGWKIHHQNFYLRNNIYATTFGDPELKGSTEYEQVVAEVILERHNRWLTFFKLIIGLWVAFLVAAMAFMVPSIYNTPKFSASVGGLWAAIGNKHIADMYVPSSDTISLIDSLHLITFMAMLIIICIAVYTLRLQHREEIDKVVLVNKWSFRIILVGYILINIILIGWANL
jgi:hypothetical protein